MDDDRYVLQQRLQELVGHANVSFRNFKAMHHVSFTTFYEFVKNPSIARPRTVTSIRLICEFLEAACKARLLPLDKTQREHTPEVLNTLYTKWFDNGKRFPETVKPVDEIINELEQ